MKRWSILGVPLAFGLVLGIFLSGPFTQGQVTPPVSTPKELTSFRGVVKTVLPAVVSIEARSKVVKTKTKGRTPVVPFEQGQVPEEFRRFFEDFGGRLPDQSETPHVGFGSGFLVDPSGVILTNFHVVDGADQVTVTLNDGRKFVAKNIRGDRRTDLAIVPLDAKRARSRRWSWPIRCAARSATASWRSEHRSA